MKILAIDTATEVCSVAILENKNVILERTLDAVNTHSVALMPLVKEVLCKCNLSINDIDLFACDNGPGSFTGIRIGLSTIKAFCDVTDKPCIGISSLEGFAYKCNILSSDYCICSLLNANHGNAYCGLFNFSDGKIVQIHDYFFNSLNNILEFVKKLEKNIFFVGNCTIFLEDMIELKSMNIKIDNNPTYTISSTDIGRAAFDKFSEGNFVDSNFLLPLYLKPSSAESNGKN